MLLLSPPDPGGVRRRTADRTPAAVVAHAGPTAAKTNSARLPRDRHTRSSRLPLLRRGAEAADPALGGVAGYLIVRGDARHGSDLLEDRREVVGGTPVDAPARGRRRGGRGDTNPFRGCLTLRRGGSACRGSLARRRWWGLRRCRFSGGLRRGLLNGARR